MNRPVRVWQGMYELAMIWLNGNEYRLFTNTHKQKTKYQIATLSVNLFCISRIYYSKLVENIYQFVSSHLTITRSLIILLIVVHELSRLCFNESLHLKRIAYSTQSKRWETKFLFFFRLSKSTMPPKFYLIVAIDEILCYLCLQRSPEYETWSLTFWTFLLINDES